jgi:hypothetical protein
MENQIKIEHEIKRKKRLRRGNITWRKEKSKTQKKNGKPNMKEKKPFVQNKTEKRKI